MNVPGARSLALAAQLRHYEQRNVTYLADDFPIFWQAANGATVTDADGNEYIDCTAAFGVANAGHSNPRVGHAVADQAARLMHGMGDVHPTEIRIRLFERLAALLPAGLNRFFLATTGSEAIEAALKTAMLATGKHRFAAFHGAYHGLSFGALAVGGIDRFRAPFARALTETPLLLDFPREGTQVSEAAASTDRALAERDDLAAIVIEPTQGRAGAIVPPPGYLRELRRICNERGLLMIVDEIFTGFGRTGRWFAIEHDDVLPDILCIGKALGSGVPISAAVGRESVMDAWPLSSGESLHTSTYLGNPLGCAAALATIEELERLDLPNRAGRLGNAMCSRLQTFRSHRCVTGVRGRGLLHAVELDRAERAQRVVRNALRSGVIFLQSGVAGNVVTISPPLVIEEEQLDRSIEVLKAAIEESE
ncbi:MAG TPA: aspartate aminotransferase family protein [Candidatus Cybelea sp.]|nr:aspartate aminotransferase family protein [Candidatus Cybelea sp.]